MGTWPLRRRSALAGVVACAALVSTVAPTAAFTNTYGNRSDQSSFSIVADVAVAPDGGLVVIGWYWGTFEGHQSPDGYSHYVMKLDTDGSIDWINTFDVPGEKMFEGTPADAGFSLAVLDDGAIWMTPGPGGGAARVDESSVTERTAGPQATIVASTSEQIFVNIGGSGSVLSSAGDPVFTPDLSALLAGEGISGASILSASVRADPASSEWYASAVFKRPGPFSDRELVVFRLDRTGAVEWSTLVSEDGDVCVPNVRVTGGQLSAFCLDKAYEFDRTDGTLSVLPVASVPTMFCAEPDAKVAVAVQAECPPGMGVVSIESSSLQPPGSAALVSISSSSGSQDVVTNAGKTELPAALARWVREPSGWTLALVVMPYGVDPSDDNAVFGVAFDGAELMVGGYLGREATVPAGGRREAASSDLFSAFVDTNADSNVVDGRPSAPSRVAATRDRRTSARVSWAAPSRLRGASLTGFVVQRQRANGSWVRLASTGGSVRSTRVRNLVPGRAYRIRVLARSAAGLGEPSAVRVIAKRVVRST